MLKSLELKNYLTIKELKVCFEEKLNIITGETGAGKSLILSSIQVFINKKFPKELKKNTNENLEILLEITDNSKILILKRVVNNKFQSSYFINDKKILFQDIKEVFDKNFTFFGQKSYVELLSVKNHINYLDVYGSYQNFIKEYNILFHEYTKLNSELEKFQRIRKDYIEKKDFYSFQLNELNGLEIDSEEKELEYSDLLKVSRERTSNNELLTNSLNNIDSNVLKNLGRIIKELNQLDFLKKESEILNSSYTDIEEVSFNLSKLLNSTEHTYEDLEKIESKIYYSKELKRKYGMTITELLEQKNYLNNLINNSEDYSKKINELEVARESKKNEIMKLAKEISRKRKLSADKLSKKIIKHLSELGMNEAVWIILQREILFNKDGIDEVEFLFSSAKDLTPESLSKVASGGEVSRIMLSLGLELSNSYEAKTIIFDEPDVGLGGAIAEKLGQKIYDLSFNTQTICISHLPQVASFANNHLLVKKTDSRNIMIEVIELNKKERIDEIARMLSGEIMEEEAYILAKKMIK